jgi:gamma-glutamyltranspeptidase/glutathione hydrolase
MVVAAHPSAAEAGRAMLNAGGGAVDAAIAAAIVLTLVEPQSSGIGGGGFLLHYDRRGRRVDAYDGRETAPAGAHPEMFLDAAGSPRPFDDVVAGGLSVGVPGLVRMLAAAHRNHGRLPWSALFEPAIALAERGFPVSPRLAVQIAGDRQLPASPTAFGYFFDAGGRPVAAGAVLRNPELAETLRIIARDDGDAFYSGAIADDVAKAVRTAWRNPGTLTAADLAGYTSVRRQPVCGPYRLWMVCGMPPPSSGGITTLQILGMLQTFDLGRLGPDSDQAWHLLAEAGRLAFADRAAYLGDPGSMTVPAERLLDPRYLAERSRLIDEERAMAVARPGVIVTDRRPPTAATDLARPSTSHLGVVDRDGNAASLTASIEGTFGSRLMVRGFLLNNQLTDFAFVPTRDDAPVPNRAGPGKRPLSSMAPTLVFDDGGDLRMVIGSPGGSRIIGYVAKALIAVLDWQLPIQRAVDLPNVVNRNGPTELEAGSGLEGLAAALRRRGHLVEERDLVSGLNGILLGPQGLSGGADRRREGVARGD